MSEPSRDSRATTEREPQSLADSVRTNLDEARMILPGTQTLFGFQLIVVFNQTFQDRLSAGERALHLAATALVALATALLIAPAAYHRQAEPERASRRFVVLSSRLLTWSTVPLMLAVCADLYLVGVVATGRREVGIGVAAVLLAVFLALWIVLPRRAGAVGRF